VEPNSPDFKNGDEILEAKLQLAPIVVDDLDLHK
jgi:hypothetical protein